MNRTCILLVALIAAGILGWPLEAAAAETVEKVTLTAVRASSAEVDGEDGKAANAVDGDPETVWHTQWQDANPEHPHEIVIQITPAVRIKGLTYLPRQNDSDHGNIREYDIYVSTDGKEFGKPVRSGTFAGGKERKTVAFVPVQAGFIKLVARSEISGRPWTSAAEIGIVQEGEKVAIEPELSVVKANSEETSAEDGKAANAIDGNPETIWHTQWDGVSPAHPHELILKLEPAMKIKGFTYLPRQDETENGNIRDWEFYVSADGKDFGQPVAKGSFDRMREKKTVTFEPKACGFVKLRALSEVNDNPWTAVAEIRVIPAEE